MAFKPYDVTLDNGNRFHNAVTVTTATSTAGTTIDLGAANQFAKFLVVIDYSGLTVSGTDNEVYRFQIQISADSGFSAYTVQAEKLLGDKDATGYTHDTPAAGRTVLYADNVGVLSSTDPNIVAPLRYVRCLMITTGTTPSITVSAWLVPMT